MHRNIQIWGDRSQYIAMYYSYSSFIFTNV